MKVALYARTSTDEQHPENQFIALREYCERNKLEVYKEYTDQISGAKESRPGLDLLMQDARQGYFQAVVIWKLDRLGRSLQHLIQIIQEWNNKGINFIAITQNIDTTTPGGKLIFHIFGAIAEFEREIITERIKLSMARLKKEGKLRGRPFGAKDKKRRRTSGYNLRWQNRKQVTPPKMPIISMENTIINKE
jgi:DNA invertase Pin-like site-specific DNA recombinase